MICLTSSGHRFDEHGFASVNCTPSTAKFLRFDEHVFTLSIFAICQIVFSIWLRSGFRPGLREASEMVKYRSDRWEVHYDSCCCCLSAGHLWVGCLLFENGCLLFMGCLCLLFVVCLCLFVCLVVVVVDDDDSLLFVCCLLVVCCCC